MKPAALAAQRPACQFARMVEAAKTNDPSQHAAAREDRYALRAGEVTVELPAQFDASLYFIGRIRTPWQRREECPKNGRESDAVCTVELDPRYVEALHNRACLLARLGDPGAEAGFDAVLAAAPDHAGALAARS